MAAADTLIDAIPLAKDPQGVYRIGGTRVSLDVVIRAFYRGAAAEDISQKFPSLKLGDVYQVLGYYLNHAKELSEYLEDRSRMEEDALATNQSVWSPAGLRERLLARYE